MSSIATASLLSFPPLIVVPIQLRYSKAEAARMLGISEAEVKRLILSGDLSTGNHGRLRLIPHSELMRFYRAWLADNGIEDEAEEGEHIERETKKEAPRRQASRTQTRKPRSSAKNKSQHGHP